MSGTWGYFIMAGAVFFGLRASVPARYRYAAVCAIALVGVAYAALKQHIY